MGIVKTIAGETINEREKAALNVFQTPSVLGMLKTAILLMRYSLPNERKFNLN